MQVARVIGAQASVYQALERAREVKGTPKWMIRYLESAAERLPGLSTDLATLRDQCHDAHIWKSKPAVRCEHCYAITGHHAGCPNKPKEQSDGLS
jgi:hypothetical protein